MTKISPPATKNDLNDLRHDMNNRFGEMENRFGEMENRFDIMEEHFVQWKSEIHNLIDAGFTSKAKNLI
jgi:hypothetical protein